MDSRHLQVGRSSAYTVSMTATQQTQPGHMPSWRDLLALPLALLGSLAGCFVGARLFLVVWDRGPFVPAIIGACIGVAVLILTRRGGMVVALIPALAATMMQLILHHQVRPYGVGDFYDFLEKLIHNITPAILFAHAAGIVLAAGLPGLAPLLWKKR